MVATTDAARLHAEQSGISITVGILSAVLSSLCQSVGLILQRKSHLNYEKKSTHYYKPPYKRSLWRVGFLLFILSNVFGSSIQITTLPLIILSPLQSIGLVFNSLFSSLILNEVFTRNSCIGTVLIVLGAFLIATFGRLPEPDYDLDQFIGFLQRRKFVTWCSCNVVVVVLLLGWIVLSFNSVHYVQLAHDSDPETPETGSSAEEEEESLILDNDNFINSTLSNEYEHFQQREHVETPQWHKLLSRHWRRIKNWSHRLNLLVLLQFSSVDRKKISLLQGIFFGWVSGTLSGFSLLLAKSTIEILVNCITSKSNLDKILRQPMIWLVVCTFLVLCLSQLWFLNQGLKLITTSILYPLVFCIYNIVNIGNELIFFDQWAVVSAWQLANICLGTNLVFVGVLYLSWRLEDFDGDNAVVEDSTRLRSAPRLSSVTNAGHTEHPHRHHSHQRNFSLDSSANKRVGLSSILLVKSPVEPLQGEPVFEVIHESERSSLKSTPVFKNYFTFHNSFSSTPQRTPTKTSRGNNTLTINTSPQEAEFDEGHSEYISFGSPNNKFSPSTSEFDRLPEPELLSSPLSAKRSQFQPSLAPTPTKLKYEINGFQTTDIDLVSNRSSTSIAERDAAVTTPKKKYGSLGNIFGGVVVGNGSAHQPQLGHSRHGKRFLSFEQNELLNQLKQG